MAEALKRYDATSETWVTVTTVNRIEVQGGGGGSGICFTIGNAANEEDGDTKIVNHIAFFATITPA